MDEEGGSGSPPTLLPGREAALSELRRWLDEVPRRGSRLGLVRGAPEDAPDRVVSAFAEEARRRGHPVFRTRLGSGGTRAFATALSRDVEGWLRRLGRPAPPEARTLRTLVARPVSGEPSDRERPLAVSEAVGAMLGAVSREHPAVLVLEELPASGPDTIELLAYILDGDAGYLGLGAAPGAPRLFAVAVLGDDAAPIPKAIPRETVRQLRVGPLGEEDLARLLASPDVVRRIAERTGGHVRLFDGLLHPPQPPQVADLVGALAVLARPARADEISGVAGAADVAASQLDDRLAVRPELVRDGAGRWRFVENGERAWVYRRLSAATRRAMHRRAARLPDMSPLDAFRHARQADDSEMALRLARPAADALVADGAPGAAAELLEPLIDDPANADERHGLRARVADLLWAGGDWPRALVHAEALAAERPDDPAAALRIARLLEGMGKGRRADSALRQAAELARRAAAPDLEVEAEALLAAARYRANALDEARALATGALGRAERLERTDIAFDARNVLGKIALQQGRLPEAAERFEALAADARAAGSGRHEAQASTNLAITVATTGDPDRARRLLEEAVAIGGRCGAPFERAFALRNLAWLEHASGDLDAALADYQRAVAAFKRLGDREVLVRLAVNLAKLHLAQGDLPRAEGLEHFARSLLEGEASVVVRAEVDELSSVVALASGRLGRARRIVERLDAEARHLTPWLSSTVTFALGEVAIEEGRLDDVRRCLERSADDTSPLAPARRALLEAELARASGAPTVPLATIALDRAEAAGHPMRTLEAHVLLGQALLDEDRVDDARTQVVRANAIAGDRGLAPPLRRKLDALTARLAARHEPAGTSSPEETGPGSERGSARGTSRRRSSRAPGVAALVGSSGPMAGVRRLVERVGPSTSSVLVVGESGTGKELVARAIHDESPRRDAPFVSVNCAAFVDSLLPSELFGHERGAFTGADRRRRGKFELADGGTLFLDEVGDVSPAMQAALLRVLQDGTFHRVGGTEPVQVNVRVVSATNRNLERMVAEGRSGRTCTTGCASSRSGRRLSGSGPGTSGSSPSICWSGSRRRRARPRRRSPRRP